MAERESYQVNLVGGEQGERATFVLDEPEHLRCVLQCQYRGKTISSEGPDFFEALALIRRQLQQDGLAPHCYGASLNVFPSGMARDMGSGLKAYRLALGTPAQIKDLVGIFDDGPDIEISDVDAQDRFFREWLNSTRA